MKTVEQIQRYIQHCRFTDDDFDRIQEFCRERYNVKSYKAKTILSESTYDQFVDWIENGYATGDVIKYANTEAVIKDCLPDTLILSAFYDYEGIPVINEIEGEHKFIRGYAQDSKLLSDIRTKGYVFEEQFGIFSEIKMPSITDRCSIVYNGNNYYGVCHEVNDDVINFYFVVNEKELITDLSVNVSEIKIHRNSRYQNSDMNNLLANNGYSWDGVSLTLKVAQPKARKNGSYWFITDRFTIMSAVEKYTLISRERFKAGNYFKEYHKALYVLEKIRETIKGQS